MKTGISDLMRVGSNLAFALAQPAISAAVFFRGFRTAAVPNAEALPTPIQPANYAFSIWSLIYLGCIAYAVFQALPRNRSGSLFRVVGWWTAIAMGLCCAWLLFARFGPVFMTVPVIVAMLVALLLAIRPVSSSRPVGPLRWLVAAPLSLYAGWLSIAAFANLQEILTGYDVRAVADAPVAWALGLIGGAACVAAGGSLLTRGNPFYLGAVLWALIAIVAANAGDKGSPSVAWASGVAGLGLMLFVTFQIHRSSKQAR